MQSTDPQLLHPSARQTNTMCLFAVIAAILIAVPLHAQPMITLVDVLEPLYPDSNSLEKYGRDYEAHFPSGTVADVHVLVAALPGDTFTISALMEGVVVPATCWSQLVDVPVEQNTGLDSRTEMFTNQVNPYVIRRAPFRVYEALQPLTTATVTAKRPFTAFRLSVPPGMLTSQGKHRILISATGKTWQQLGTFTADIHRVSVPTLRESTFFYTNWFSLPQMEEKHGVARWSKEWYAMLDTYAALMASGRQNCIIVPAELISVTDGRITLDEQKMASFIDVFKAHGFRYFESPHLMYRGDADDWGDPDLKVYLTKRPYGTAGGKKDVETIVRLIRDFTSTHGLNDGWLQHISDEPTAVQAHCYKDVVAQARSIFPQIRIMEATSDRDTLVGAVDIWCPTIDDFQKNESFFRSREQRNEKVLVYTCLVPGGKWLNRLLDQERLREVYFGWGAAHYETSGYLHWGLNQYITAHPFDTSVVHHPSPVATPNNFLPAGDTHIVYPGAAGPLSSTRFEAFRIGIEDFELLHMLKKYDAGKVAEIIRRIFNDYTEYNIDVVRYRETRRLLLEAF
jgi:hypothetical protein